MNWRLGVVLVVAAAAVHVSTFRYDTMTFPGRLLVPQPSVATVYLAGSVVLAVAAVVLAVVWKLSRVFPAAARGHVLALRDPAGLRLYRGQH